MESQFVLVERTSDQPVATTKGAKVLYDADDLDAIREYIEEKTGFERDWHELLDGSRADLRANGGD